MARKLVELADVAAAAQKLKEAGKRPTVIAIRDIIGKGSFTTISTYLKQWSEEHSLDEEPVEVALPESVINDAELFLQKIYAVAKASADEQLERERELLRQKELEYQEDMQQAVEMANDATERAELLEEQLETLTSKTTELDTALGKAENSLSLKSAELERSLADIDKLEKRMVELESKLETKAAELTRAQDSLATVKAHGKSAERECQRLSGEVEKLDTKLSSAEAEARALVQDKGIMAGQLQEKDRQSKSLEQRLDDALTQISGLEQERIKAGEGAKKEEKK